MRFFTLFFFLCSVPAFALDWDGKGDLSLANGYRSFPQNGFGPYRYAWENITLLGYQLRVYPHENLRFEARPEVRGFVSRTIGRGPAYPGFATVTGPDRLLQLDYRAVNAGTAEWLVDFERLNFVWSVGGFEAQVGRKPIGVGTLKVLPIWNKFSRPLPHTAGPNLIFGQDSATVRWQSGLWALQAIDIEGPKAKEESAVRWLEAILYHPALELHIMGARWWDRNVFGLAFAKDIGGATLRGEGLAIGLDRHGVEREVQGGLGLEYAPNETWTLLGEGLYQSDGANEKSEYTLVIPSRYRVLRAQGYLYLQASAEVQAYWNFSFAAIGNLVDRSVYPLFKVTRSLSDHVDVSLDLRAPLGKTGTEFSRRSLQFPFGRYLGAPGQAQVVLNAAF